MALSQYDQSVRDAGYKYVPQSQYLLDPFQIPQGSENEVPTGIATTYQAQSGGGGGMGYTGGITGLTTDFQKTVDARTQRLEDAYNNPSTAKLFKGIPFMEMNMFKQDVNPADAGFYVGESMRIPQERTMLGKMFQPQSPREIMEQGYEPMTNIGILNAILGKADKFGTLPRADQAFITSQMGYTGPTVFGDNQSGLSKDPFGLNTRSAFGNYAERVGTEVDKLSAALGADGAIGGKKDFQGATFNPATGMFEADEDSDLTPKQIAALNQRTNLVRTKLNFYREKVKERDELRRQDEARLEAERQAAAKRERDFAAQGRSDPNDLSRQGASGRRPGSGGPATARDDQGDRGAGQTGGYGYDSGGREGFGYGLADGGRVYYMDGGLADLVDIYD